MDKIHKDNFYERDLSQIDFNFRVLNKSTEENIPLLERCNFLGISASNMDEFFMRRAKSIKEICNTERISELNQKLKAYVSKQNEDFLSIKNELEHENIEFLRANFLSNEQKDFCDKYFLEKIKPQLEIYIQDLGDEFPFIENLELNMIVKLQAESPKVAIIKIANTLPRFFEAPSKNSRAFIMIEDLIQSKLELIFKNYKISSVTMFRITRNADVCNKLRKSTDDYLNLARCVLLKRSISYPVRLELSLNATEDIKILLQKKLNLSSRETYESPDLLDLSFMTQLSEQLDIKRLKYKALNEYIPFSTKEIFKLTKQQDLLLYHPFHSFKTVLDFLKAAAVDPNVSEIKQTLYRTAKNSEIIKALVTAAENGKKVKVFIELKANFDEEHNIKCLKTLEQAGCEIRCGIKNLKVHCKLLMVKRNNTNYLHIGTGNYNESTAKIYTDCAIFTCKKQLCLEAEQLFDFLFNDSDIAKFNFEKLLVSPFNLRKKLKELIQKEIANAKQGLRSEIIIKVNSLSDMDIISLLYEAAENGVKIKLMVRGICCINTTANIKITSIVGRFLEHSRIFYFKNAGDTKVFIGSSDLRSSNLDQRVEVLVPIEDKKIKNQILSASKIIFEDSVNASKKIGSKYFEVLKEDRSFSDSHEKLQEFFRQNSISKSDKIRGLQK